MSFWSKLGKGLLVGGGGFLAPFTGGSSLAASLALGGIGGATTLLGGGGGGTPKPGTATGSMPGLTTAQQLGLDTAKTNIPVAQNLIGLGTQQMQQPANYWSSILSNNRADITSALAPEISRIGQGYQTAEQTSAALNPRGGPSAEFNAELPFAQQRDVSTLLQGARPEAAKSLFTAGQATTQAGTSVMDSATRSLLGSTDAGRAILADEAARRAATAANHAAIGKGLFDLVQKYGPQIFDKLSGRGGTGGKTTVSDIGGNA